MSPHAVVRPSLFFRPEVAGALIPCTSFQGDDLKLEYQLALRHPDGRRELVPFTKRLDVGGKSIGLYPSPPRQLGTNTSTVWTREFADEWVKAGVTSVVDAIRSAEAHIRSRVWFPEAEREGVYAVLTLWTLLTHVAPMFKAVPYLHITGEPDSGKTETLNALKDLVFRPIASSNTSAPALFRYLDTLGGTLLLDEAEHLGGGFGQQSELMPMLLSGYKPGSPVLRCHGDDHDVREFNVFGPKAIAGITILPPALRSRCIPLEMCPRPLGEASTPPAVNPRGIASQLLAVALDHAFDLQDRIAAGPRDNGLANRRAEVWGPLFILARFLAERGVSGLLERLTTYVEAADESAAGPVTPHLAAGLALLGLRRMGATPTCGEVLKRLQHEDPVTWTGTSDRRVGALLRSIGLPGDRESRGFTFRQSVAEIENAIRKAGGSVPNATEACASTAGETQSEPAPEQAA
ncbi:MAG: hypothetical protein KDA05_04710 [Phycisphaerales bacterium]|nr:hypothetical protein [Phycisphaerales bacterium]